MNNTLYEILDSREDLSKYLFHFTKGRKAKDTLVSIINDGKIKDINQTGRICFSEAPVTILAPMFNIFKRYRNPMFAPYGIGIRKDVVYKNGGRPVILGDERDEKFLPQKLRWRFELFHPEKHDFTWLREWRLPKNNIELPFDDCFFIHLDAYSRPLKPDPLDFFLFRSSYFSLKSTAFLTSGIISIE